MAKAKAVKEVKDVVGDINALLIAAMEAGTPPWIRDWSAGSRFPCNARTGHRYAFGNALILQMSMAVNGWSRNEWVTYRGAAEVSNAERPLPGQKGTLICQPRLVQLTKDKDGNVLPDDEHIKFMRFGGLTVFNIEQVTELKEEYSLVQHTFEPDCSIESLLAAVPFELIAGQHAAFRPATNQLIMPPADQFVDTDAYYSTLFHELTHWTGGASQMNRKLVSFESDPKAYAFEELIAELGSAYLCAYFGIKNETRHASYLNVWLGHFKGDKSFFFSAAARAQKAAEYLLAYAVESVSVDDVDADLDQKLAA